MLIWSARDSLCARFSAIMPPLRRAQSLGYLESMDLAYRQDIQTRAILRLTSACSSLLATPFFV